MSELNEIFTTEARVLSALYMCEESGGWVVIKGYQSSDGAVKDITCRPLPPGGYNRLVRESHEQLAAAETPAGYEAAKAKVLQAFAASMQRAEAGEQTRAAVYVEQKGDPLGVARHAEDPEVMYLINMESHTAPEGEPKGASELVRQSNELKARLPISRFIGALKLAPGKFESIDWQELPHG
jgi:hypothetical protein